MSTPTVTVNEGILKGKTAVNFLGGTYYCFLGIPYAKAPVGELRFKAPQPTEPWEGIRDATKEGPECPSRYNMLRLFYHIGSEDNCLNLNIFTPELPSEGSKLKPVMVWIHGGAFLYGSNRRVIYGPDYLITEDVVIVCINYRLGVLGFLSLDDPSLGVPGNAGMKDMVLALKWIKANIKNFSGDPNNVTIFGESAGGTSVHYLYLSSMAKGLFHKAIAQSGSSLNGWAQGKKPNSLDIARVLGLEETDEKKILEYLKRLPVQKIVEAQHKIPDPFYAGTVRPFGPVVENTPHEEMFLDKSPTDIIKSGTFNDVPLIMGYTSREGMLFDTYRNLLSRTPLTKNIENEIFHYLELPTGSKESLDKAREIKEFYYGEEEVSEKNIDKSYLIQTDNLFLYGIHQSVSNQKLKSTSPIYFYKMTLESELNFFKKMSMSKHFYIFMGLNVIGFLAGNGLIKSFFKRLAELVPKNEQPGVSHADDLSYLFRSLFSPPLDPDSIEAKYVRRFIKLWANFAKTGNPTPNTDDELLQVLWKPVDKKENCLLNIGTDLEMEIDPDRERMEFWDTICKHE